MSGEPQESKSEQEEDLGDEDYYPDYNPNDFYDEPKELIDRINEAREGAELIKSNLHGLRYRPASVYEEENAGSLSPERIKELEEREESISWFSYCYISSYKEFDIKKEDLKKARYFTIKELIERADSRINLFQRAKVEVQNHNTDQPALQMLADEYEEKDETFFDTDEKTGSVAVKKIGEKNIGEVQKKIDDIIKDLQSYSSQISGILESSRTGIDIGVLGIEESEKKLFIDMAGFYITGQNFIGNLARTGLIVVPPFLDPGTLKHEYAHFEDWIFRNEKREKFDELISEINSFLIEDKEDLSKGHPNLVFAGIKGTLLQHYLKGNKPESEGLKDARKKINRSVDVISRLYKNGFSTETISSILMQADKFEDILQWDNINDEELRKLAKKKKKNISLPI